MSQRYFFICLLLLASCGTPRSVTPPATPPRPTIEQPTNIPAAQPTATQPATSQPAPLPTATLGNYTPTFTRGACEFKLPRGRAEGRNMYCGTLTVPADRTNPTGPAITLAVAVLSALGPKPQPDPVVYLDGGPGGETLGGSSEFFSLDFAPDLQQNHDLVLFDQRGVGLSRPTLDCPEYSQAIYATLTKPLSIEEADQRDGAAYETCRTRILAQGVDIRWFSSAASAADVHDLMLALGYTQWNLFGVSYGTRLALTVMRDQPDGVRSVVLDSVYPLDVNRYIDLPLVAQRVFDTLFAGCAADTECATLHPNLDQHFYALVKRLNDRPILVNTQNYGDGKTYDILIDGDTIVGMLFNSFYITSLIPDLPDLISRADSETARGETNALSEWGWVNFLFDGISDGAYNAIECREEVPFAGPDALAETAKQVRPEIAHVYGDPFFITYCPNWAPGPPDPRENQAVHSNIPTLLLAGEYDPVTPASYARRVAQELSTATLLEFPGLGHATFTQPCPLQLISDFFVDPTEPLNTACQQAMQPPAFR